MPRVPNLRVAIVGAGLMGRAHARAIQRAGGNIVAVVDGDQMAAKRLASSIGKDVIPGKLEDLLTSATLDAVHVCTPAGQRAESCSVAIDRGLHVLCEKPLANNTDETQTLLDFA